MVHKAENFQLPAGEKVGSSDEEFADELEATKIEFEALLQLKKEYAEKKQRLERLKDEKYSLEVRKKLDYIELQTGRNLIESSEKELCDLDIQIKHASKKIHKVISDPRYAELRFKFFPEIER